MSTWNRIVLSAVDETGPAFSSARGNVKGLTSDVKDSASVLQGWGQRLLAGVTIGAAVGKLVSVQREFDVLNSSLITVTGSSAAAAREMEWIKQFAKETPFGLAQATEGFVKMKALGLDPSKEALTSFGNTAAAMGKDLKQMIEAVADASTGEFERLKEFGIKARKEGSDVALTFQGVTTTVKNNADEITRYLEAIGNKEFAGAMAERAKTLDGAIAELGDTWDELFRTVNQNGAGTLIADTVRLATAAVADFTEILDAATRSTDSTARATGALTTIQSGLGVVFETVTVLALDVKYQIEAIGTALGGLAAQAVAVARLQFSEVAEIRRLMREDAAQLEAEYSATIARVMNARADAANRSSALAGQANTGLDAYVRGLDRAARPAASGGDGPATPRPRAARAATERESAEARAYAQAMEAIAKAQLTAVTSGEAYTATQKRLIDIMTSPEWRAMPEAWRVLIAQQGEAAIMAEQHADAQQKMLAARQAELSAVQRDTAALADGNAQLRQQIDMLGMTTAERLDYTRAINAGTIAKLKDKASSLEMLDAESDLARQLREQIAALEDRNALLGHQAEKEQYLAEQAQLVEFWKSVDQTAHDVFVNIFEDGAGTFKRLGQTLKSAVLDMLYQLTIKRWIINIGASFSGNPASFAQAMGGQGGGLLGNASNLQSAYSWLTGGYQNTLSNIASFFGFGGAAAPTMTSAAGSVYAGFAGAPATYAPAITGFSGTPIAGGSTGFGAGAGVSAAGLAAIAAPIIVGMLAERNSRDRYGGAAYATSNWQSDAFVNAAGADFNALTGDIPNRDALIERAIAAGIERSTVDLFQGNDRALLHYVRMAEDPNRNEFGGLPDPRKLIADGNLYEADFYRGQGFASPEEMGWWNNKGGDLTAVDPRVVEASRALSLSIVGPLSDMARMLGDAEAEFRVTTGFANRGKGAMWGALDIQRGGESIGGFGQGDFANVQEYMRAVYSEAMDAFSAMDLPEWARGQVEGAQTAMDALTGDKLGQEAAALYAQTTAGIEQMYRSIQMLIDVFPDFSAATQDSLFALQELMGGMDQLQSAYSSYIGAFWTEDERRELMTAQLTAQLAELGQTMPTTRAEFRGMVEAALAAGESGNELAAALLGMSGAMSEVLAEVDAAAEAAQALADAQAAAKQRTDDVWQQLHTLFAEQISNWRDLGNEAKSIFAMATSAARDLRGDVSSTRDWEAARSNAMIDQALAAARASGVLPDADDLSRAISGARAGMDMDGYASVAEYERDQLVLAGKLAELGDVAGGQMSFAEQQVRLLEEQRDYWKKQIDQLRRTDLTITSIDEGVTYLADALRAEHAAQAAAEVEAQSAAARAGKGTFGGGGYSAARPATPQGEWNADEGRLYFDNNYIDFATGLRHYDDGSVSQVPLPQSLLEQWLEEVLSGKYHQPIHGFAAGGLHTGGLRLVGERGPELEFTGPARYWSFEQSQRMLSGGGAGNEERLATLLQAVLRELGAIRADTKEISDLEFRLVSLVRRVTGEGNAMRTQEVPA